MVASSRLSFRRPTLRGDHNTSRSASPIADNTSPKSAHEAVRPKRSRVTSISDREQLQKRRKVATKPERGGVRIPLRGKDGRSEGVLPPSVTRSIPALQTATQTSSSTSSPLDSPSIKPQYDQIKRIEEKARAQIQKENANPEKKDDRRRLRSEHGGSRAKTELAQYFPAFDEMLSLEQPRSDALTSSTRLLVIDDVPDFQPEPARADPFGARKRLHNITLNSLPVSTASSHHVAHDPLGPDVYYKAHRKAERHEKQMKNGDKERAQHEKYQLDKLLDELRGPDWLKTLGITGITDTEKKRYEPKRALFIRETKALIEKFKRWKEEEKRRKIEKEQAQIADAEEAEETEAAASTSTRRQRKRGMGTSKPQSIASSEKGPDPSELDLLASRQLLLEAKSANVRRKRVASVEGTAILDAASPLLLPPPPPQLPQPEVHKPFISFFEKRHIRDAAVAGRQRGRTVLAFGEPVPDMIHDDFDLPESILTDEAIRASQRSRRRVRRNPDG